MSVKEHKAVIQSARTSSTPAHTVTLCVGAVLKVICVSPRSHGVEHQLRASTNPELYVHVANVAHQLATTIQP